MNTDVRDRLQRVRRLAPPPRFDLESTLRRGERRSAARRLGVTAFALMIGAGGLVGAVVAFGHSSSPRLSTASPAPALAPGQYLYRGTTRFWIDTCGVGGDTRGCNLGTRDDVRAAVMTEAGDALRVPAIEPLVSRLWWSTSGVRLWERSPELEFFQPGDRDRFAELYGAGTVSALPAEDRSFGAGEFDPPDYTFPGWSRDPATLARQLEDAASPGASSPVPAVSPGSGQNSSTGGQVRILREMIPLAAPDLQQALFEAAQSIQGMEFVQEASDPAGRDALALRITTEGVERAWFFDPTTHLLLGGTVTSPETGFAWETWYVSELAIVSSPNTRPSGSDNMVPPVADRLPSFVDPRTSHQG